MKILFTLTFFVFLLNHPKSIAQSAINVTYYDGNVQPFSIETSGKLFFESNNLLVKLDANTAPTTIPISIIRKITFVNNLPPLASELFQFNVLNKDCGATVVWSSETELNLDHYELLFGHNENQFDHSQTISPKGNYQNYFVSLNHSQGEQFYQLKMVDKDQSVSYSSILNRNIVCRANNYTLSNTLNHSNTIKILTDVSEDLKIKIYSVSGQLIHSATYQPNQDIDISTLSAGLYLIQVNGITLKFSKI